MKMKDVPCRSLSQSFGQTCGKNAFFLSLFTVKYKLPSALFSSHVRLNNLWSALEGFPGEGLEVPEACGLHPSPEVSKLTVCHTVLVQLSSRRVVGNPWDRAGRGGSVAK